MDKDITPAITKEDIKKLVKHKNGENKNFTEDKVYFNSKVPLAYHYINENSNLNPEKQKKVMDNMSLLLLVEAKLKSRINMIGVESLQIHNF